VNRVGLSLILNHAHKPVNLILHVIEMMTSTIGTEQNLRQFFVLSFFLLWHQN